MSLKNVPLGPFQTSYLICAERLFGWEKRRIMFLYEPGVYISNFELWMGCQTGQEVEIRTQTHHVVLL